MIVDDVERFRALVRARIAQEAQLELVAEAAEADEALAFLPQARPDVVVLAHGLPRLNGLELAREILRRRPDQVIVLMAGEMGEERRRLAHEAGVQGCITKFALGDLPELILRLIGPASKVTA